MYLSILNPKEYLVPGGFPDAFQISPLACASEKKLWILLLLTCPVHWRFSFSSVQFCIKGPAWVVSANSGPESLRPLGPPPPKRQITSPALHLQISFGSINNAVFVYNCVSYVSRLLRLDRVKISIYFWGEAVLVFGKYFRRGEFWVLEICCCNNVDVSVRKLYFYIFIWNSSKLSHFKYYLINRHYASAIGQSSIKVFLKEEHVSKNIFRTINDSRNIKFCWHFWNIRR